MRVLKVRRWGAFQNFHLPWMQRGCPAVYARPVTGESSGGGRSSTKTITPPAGFAGSARRLPMAAVPATSAGCPTRCFSGWLFFLFPMGLLRDGTNVIILATKPGKRCVKHASATPRSRADHIAYLVRSPGRANSRHRLWAVLGYSRERALRFWLGASGSLRLGCLHSKL